MMLHFHISLAITACVITIAIPKVLSATRIFLFADSAPIADTQIDGDYMEINYDESPVFISIQY